MKIVVLDGYTLNPGDLSWQDLENLGECVIYERTAVNDIIARAKEAEIILTNKTPLDRATLLALPQLKYIGVLATGYNVVDIKTAQEKNITITNVPDYSSYSVAQMVFALLFELTHSITHYDNTVKQGQWSQSKDFCYWDKPLIAIEDLTIGIVGFGQIGKKVAAIAQAFGMQVLVYTPRPDTTFQEIVFVDLKTLFATSDVISLHCPLTEQNKGFVNQSLLQTMKSNAYLINTSRGALINEQALANALNNEKIQGAGLDVLAIEPPVSDNPLFSAKNCIITPHIAWATKTARQRLLNIVVDNIQAFLNGRPKNSIS